MGQFTTKGIFILVSLGLFFEVVLWLCSGGYRACSPNEFQCDNGSCIPSVYLCDGHSNCPNAEDERSCQIGYCLLFYAYFLVQSFCGRMPFLSPTGRNCWPSSFLHPEMEKEDWLMQVHLEKWPFKWSVYVYDITREELNSLVIEVLDFHQMYMGSVIAGN